MKEELNLFCRSLDKSHFESAVEMRNELIEQNHPQDELRINTKDLYEQAFNFPNVAQYDNVQA